MPDKKLFSSITKARDVFNSLRKVVQNISSLKDSMLKLTINESDGVYSKEFSYSGKEFADSKKFEALFKDFENHKWLSPTFSVNVVSGSYNDNVFILVPCQNSTGYDIQIFGNNERTRKCFIEVADSFSDNFPQITTKFDFVCERILPEEKLLFDARQTAVNTLLDASKNILEGLTKKDEEWHEKILKYENELDQKYKAREESLGKKFSEKENKYDADRQKFEEEKKAFNNSENKRVRRDLLERIEKIITENKTIKLSQGTEQKEKPIIRICGILGSSSMVISFIFISLIILLFIKNNSIEYALLFPASTFFFIFLSTTVYLIRWHGQIFRMHADAELANKKFETDILRAGWLAEMYFEWEEKKEAEFPPQMIESFTRNLFESNNRQERVTHPLEDVIKIASQFNKFSVGKNGLELETAKKTTN